MKLPAVKTRTGLDGRAKSANHQGLTLIIGHFLHSYLLLQFTLNLSYCSFFKTYIFLSAKNIKTKIIVEIKKKKKNHNLYF